MNAQLIAIYAEICAANARVEGYKAENTQRAAQGDSPAYREDVFSSEANALSHLADAARDCK